MKLIIGLLDINKKLNLNVSKNKYLLNYIFILSKNIF